MKKLSYITIKKKSLLIIPLLFMLILSFYLIPKTIKSSSPKTKYTVVIDAGHGGIDGGSVGICTNVSESTLNLEYANCLKSMLTNFGFNVVMTRTNESGLYNPLASNKKRDDMKKRKSIIENSYADFVVSIHMNSYNTKSCGAQVFYGENDEPSKFLANNIQKYFIKYLTKARKTTEVGDYYMLNAIKSPSVLVECGYLSNPEEEKLLIDDKYKEEVCYCILLGILEYLN